MHDHVIATAGAPELAKILEKREKQQNAGPGYPLTVPPTKSISCLKEYNYAVNIMVVNLHYSTDVIPVKGFGYLIPRSISMEQNPERALGVIFASQATPGLNTAPGDSVTVLLGGHFWDGWEEPDFPDHDTAVDMARSLLRRHLGVTQLPIVSRSRLHCNAIPQYTVGHVSRMRHLSKAVSEEFRHRLTLAGNWYGDAGVPDCVRQAYIAGTFSLLPVDAMPLGFEGGLATHPHRPRMRKIATS